VKPFYSQYQHISDEERKAIISYLIKEILIYPHGEADQPLKSIEFYFPVYRDRQVIKELLWEPGNTVETVFLLSRVSRIVPGFVDRYCRDRYN